MYIHTHTHTHTHTSIFMYACMYTHVPSCSCPQGCDTPEDTSWTHMSAFLGESVHLDEAATLENGYVENAVNFLVFKLEDADMFKGPSGAAQRFLSFRSFFFFDE